MAIEVQDGFNVSTNKPIDDRYVKATLMERDALVPEVRYIGLTCYVVSENKRYILKEGITNDDWEDDTGGGGSGSGGGIGGIEYFSSASFESKDWQFSHPAQASLEVTETSKFIRPTEIKWESGPVGDSTRWVRSPKLPFGDVLRVGRILEGTVLELSGYFRFFSGVESPIAVGLSIVGLDENGDVVYTRPISLNLYNGQYSLRSGQVMLNAVLGTVKEFRLEISLDYSTANTTILYMDDISVRVVVPQARKVNTVVDFPSQQYTIRDDDDIVIINPLNNENDKIDIYPPSGRKSFTVKYVPIPNGEGYLNIINAEPEYQEMYSNMARTFVYDTVSNIWRAI